MRRSGFHDRPPKKPVPRAMGLSNNDLSKRQEDRIARRVGGRRMPASGALPYAKGDVANKLHLIEAKVTSKKSMRVETKWLTKITREARERGKDPALAISLLQLPSDIDQDWIMVPLAVFNRLSSGKD